MAQDSASPGNPGRAAESAPGRVMAGALLAGLMAGAAVGLIDGLWSWRAMAQFAPSFGDRIRTLMFLASLYGLFAAIVAWAGAGALCLLLRTSRLGYVIEALSRAHDQARERGPQHALIGLSVAIAGPPLVAGSLALAFWWSWTNLAARKHLGLMLASSMGAGLVAVALAAILALPVARLIELGLIRLSKRAPWAKALSSIKAPFVAATCVTGLLVVLAAAVFWDTLRLLNLRPLVAIAFALALAGPTWIIGRTLAYRFTARPRWIQRSILVLCPVLLAGATLSLGERESAREAAVAHSGLAAPLTRLIQKASDLDGDGYGRLLGGGDCDDGDAQVHPGMRDIPGDGIDNNCLMGDAKAQVLVPPVMHALPPSVPKDFRVLLITIDTLRADHMGAYGYQRDTTPNLDALAERSALFENAWAHAPSTRYSIPAILTGRYPLEVSYFNIPRQWPGIATSNTTIAELLTQNGFTSAAILNYWYFDKHRKMNQGFAKYDNSNSRLHKGVRGEGPAKTTGSSSQQQTDKAISVIDELAAERFFLWVHYYDPHFDYETHPDTPSFGPRPVDQYDHEIRFTDQHIGRLLAHLSSRGLDDKTVVVVTGDHGEGFGEHGIDLHGYHLYAAQTRVPLIMHIPGLPATRTTMPAGHVDILPTLANLLGTQAPAGAMGRSLLDVASGKPAADASDRILFQQLSYENNNEMRAAVSDKCHVIYNVSPHSSWEVYRLDKDPQETRDRSSSPGLCAPVVERLGLWYEQTEAARNPGK